MTKRDTRTYHAISVVASRTMWLNAVAVAVGVLSLTEIVTLIPPRHMPLYSVIVAALNMILRTQTVRPVAFVAPGDTKAVQVTKIDPPAKKMTD